jgi:hypothetical protein
MKHFFTITFFTIIFTMNGLQSQSIKLDTVIANYGDTVLVPLQFYGFLNTGAITMFIIYDADVLEYVGFTNLIPEGQGTLTNATMIDTNNVVGMIWTAPGASGVDFPDGKFLDFKFVFTPSFSNLVFHEPYCELLDWDGNPITAAFINGRVDHLTSITSLKSDNQNIFSYSDKLVLNFDKTGEVNLSVYDLTGRVVGSELVHIDKGSKEIDLGNLKSGFYIVKAVNKETTTTKKIYIHNN